MDPRQRFAQLEDALRIAMQARLLSLWTTLPGIVQSFDPDAVTAVVQPAISGVLQGQDGSYSQQNLPLLLDVPVVFPRGGGCSLTFPIAAGDECLVHFSARCIDGWWQNGGVQLPMEPRLHDLSDAFCVVGPQSQAKKISGISTTCVQLRSDDGQAFVEVDPVAHLVHVSTSGALTADVTGACTLNAASLALNGPVTVNGTFHATGAATFDSTVAASGDVTGSGTSLHTHRHGGVKFGTDVSGGPT